MRRNPLDAKNVPQTKKAATCREQRGRVRLEFRFKTERKKVGSSLSMTASNNSLLAVEARVNYSA